MSRWGDGQRFVFLALFSPWGTDLLLPLPTNPFFLLDGNLSIAPKFEIFCLYLLQNSELSVASVDQNLSILVARNVAKTLKLYASKCEQMVSVYKLLDKQSQLSFVNYKMYCISFFLCFFSVFLLMLVRSFDRPVTMSYSLLFFLSKNKFVTHDILGT